MSYHMIFEVLTVMFQMRRCVTDILKDYSAFAMSGTGNPVTQHEIPEDVNTTIYQPTQFNIPEDLHLKRLLTLHSFCGLPAQDMYSLLDRYQRFEGKSVSINRKEVTSTP